MMRNSGYRNAMLILGLFIFVGVLVKIATSQSVPNPNSLQWEASQSGSYVRYLAPDIYPRLDLNHVVAGSTDIITGTAQSNVCKLSLDGASITTDFHLTINSVIKGNLSAGNTIVVSIPGGKTGFSVPCTTGPCPPMNTAEIRVPWFRKMTNGNQYYLFLIGSGSIVNAQSLPFKPTNGPEGVFEISNGVVTSNSGRLRDPMWKYNNYTIANFQIEIAHAMSSPIYP